MKELLKKRIEIFGIIFSVVVLAVIGVLIFKANSEKQDSSGPLPEENIIILTDKGFVPDTQGIKINTAVRWKNTMTTTESVNSDDYPTNKLYPELNLGLFASNQTIIHVFNKPGVYKYHDQMHPEFKGTITVNP